ASRGANVEAATVATGVRPPKGLPHKEAPMTVLDFLYIIPVILALAVLRFGVPLLVTWLLGRLFGTIAHPAH
ncbi:MAG: hypothetical protein KDE24_21525, partial [Caldilinea sp.]|nr:hypothetical protein [Caldilinea sp.]